MGLEVRIERLGAQGDGVAQGPDGPLYVPLTLPGELVRVGADERAELLAVIAASPDRTAPVCPHFGVCGGCALQHMEATSLSRLEARPGRRRLQGARDRGGDRAGAAGAAREPPPRELRSPARDARGYFRISRRALQRRRRSRCLPAAYAPHRLGAAEAKADAGAAPRRPAGDANYGHGGRQRSRRGDRRRPRFAAPGERARRKRARTLGIVRFTMDGETVVRLAEPVVALSGARVGLPPGAFLQASCAAEDVLVVSGPGGHARALSASLICSLVSAPSPSRSRPTPRSMLTNRTRRRWRRSPRRRGRRRS